jgi:acyl-CoA synthetase (AMP-forming)/AMP-acid ligase II
MYPTQGLHRAVQQQPDEVMTIFGARRRTFREVAGRVARLAGVLRELGVGDGDRVAMLALNSDRYNEYLLAVPWANAVLNPVNFRWSAAEIGYSLRDSETRVLLVDDLFAPMVPALREHVKTLIAGYKAPRSMEIADALPLSGAGKVLKRELRQKYWHGNDRQVH